MRMLAYAPFFVLMIAVLMITSTAESNAQQATTQLPQWGQQHPWPMLGRDAARTGLTLVGGPEDPALVEPWPFPAGGPIFSAPVIDKLGNAYFGMAAGALFALHRNAPSILALERWHFRVESRILSAPALKERLSREDGFPVESPVRVYFATTDGDVHALDASDGAEVWQASLETQVPLPSSPLVYTITDPEDDDIGLARVYLASEDDVWQFREVDNPELPDVAVSAWNLDLVADPMPESIALALSADGQDLYTIFVDEGFDTVRVDVIQFDTGSWAGCLLDFPEPEAELPLRVVLEPGDPHGAFYLASRQGRLLKALPGTAEGRAEHPCRVRWEAEVDAPIHHPPALMPDSLIAFASEQAVYVADRDTGQLDCAECWMFDLGASPAARPVVDGLGSVYLVREDAIVQAIRNGQDLWGFPIEGEQFTAPAIDGVGRFYVGSDDQNMYVLQDVPAFTVAFESDFDQADNVDVYTLREIYGDFQSFRRLTDHPAHDGQPTYSTDGQRMAFVSDRDGSKDIFLGTAGALDAQNLTEPDPNLPFDVDTDQIEPAFSPTSLGGYSQLPDQTRYLALTHVGDERVLFFIDLDELAETGEITVHNLPDWLQRQIPGYTFDVGLEQGQAAFAPDGSKLAYVDCERGFEQLQVVNFVNGTSTTLNQNVFPGESCVDDFIGFAPAFSPDSRYLVYTHEDQLWISDLTGPGTPIAVGDLRARHPHWSPDGTEIVFTGIGPGSGASALYILQGAWYDTLTELTEPLGTERDTRFDHAEYHPLHMPEPRLIADCAVEEPLNPDALEPKQQQPRQSVQIRGCGFDIKFPERNLVFFTDAEGDGWAPATVEDAWVDPADGLGVLEVVVPDMAGDGPIAVESPVDSAMVDGFHILPLPLALRQQRSAEGAQIRVLGYGLLTTAPPQNDVLFTEAGADEPDLAAEVTEATSGLCDPELTPCPPGEDGEIQWLEVVVPEGVANGPVHVAREIDAPPFSASCPGGRCDFELLHPRIALSRYDGSHGDPARDIEPVTFRFFGEEFPMDPYFGYEEVRLEQHDPGDLGMVELGTVTLLPMDPSAPDAGEFESAPVAVQENSGGELTMRAALPGTDAGAESLFRTPMPDLPIIFVPGTSGTFLRNEAPEFLGDGCGALHPLWYVASPRIALLRELLLLPHSPNDYWEDENVWFSGHGALHVLLGCDNYLDALRFRPDSDEPLPGFESITVGEVMDEVEVGEPLVQAILQTGLDPVDDGIQDLIEELGISFADIPIYQPLFELIENEMGRPRGDTTDGSCPDEATNCWYPFNFDWRRGMDVEADRLSDLVDSVLAQTGREKVLLISHSYGSPTTQFFLRNHPDASEKVDQVIAIGGGFMGVVRPFRILQVGDNWGVGFPVLGLFGLDPHKTQELAEDWPTAYWQLPQAAWFDDPNEACRPIMNPLTGEVITHRCAFLREATRRADRDDDGPPRGNIDDADTSFEIIANAHAIKSRILEQDWLPLSFEQNVNLLKFGEALDMLDGEHALGDWRPVGHTAADWRASSYEQWRRATDDHPGTDGIFFQRVIGFSVDTDELLRYHTWPQVCITLPLVGEVCTPALDMITPRKGPGDETIPHRSAVGILDAFDDRIWAINESSDEATEGWSGDGTFHFGLTHMILVHELIQAAADGQLSSICQVFGSEEWPFEEAQGNFETVPGCADLEQETFSGGTAVQDDPEMAAESRDASDSPAVTGRESSPIAEPVRWQLSVTGAPQIRVRDEAGRLAGPHPDAPNIIVQDIPRVVFDTGAGWSHVSVPHGDTYTLELQAARHEQLFDLRLDAVDQDISARQSIAFWGAPLTENAIARMQLDTLDPPREPVLEIEFPEEEFTVSWEGVILEGTEVHDTTPPTTTIDVTDRILTVEARDDLSGVHQIFYGYGRELEDRASRVYTEPVAIPPGATHVWAFARDRAGNFQHEPSEMELDVCFDFDGTGEVGIGDVQAVASRWRDPALYDEHYDATLDGQITVEDVMLVAAHWGDRCP